MLLNESREVVHTVLKLKARCRKTEQVDAECAWGQYRKWASILLTQLTNCLNSNPLYLTQISSNLIKTEACQQQEKSTSIYSQIQVATAKQLEYYKKYSMWAWPWVALNSNGRYFVERKNIAIKYTPYTQMLFKSTVVIVLPVTCDLIHTNS